jgi:streptogrisin C
LNVFGDARRRRTVGLAAAVVAALAVAACVPSAPAPQPPRPAATPTTAPARPDDHTVTLGADVLVRQYGLSQAEALRRMRVQPTAVAAALDLQARLGLPEGAVWIDHRSGGQVVVRSNAAGAGDVAAAVGRQHGIATVAVAGDRSPEEIEALAAELAAALQAEGVDGFAVSYDPVTDTFALGLPPAGTVGEEPPPAESAEEITTEIGLSPDDVAVEELPDIQTAACTADGRHCDSPLRGATVVRAVSGSSAVYCSGGFVGRSASTGAYVLATAGHCAIGAAGRTWSAYLPTTAAWRDLGGASGGVFGATGDSSVIAVPGVAGWVPGPTIVAGPSSTTPAGSLSQSYRVEAIQRPVAGAVLCYSGASSGTSCGEVTRAGVTVVYPTGSSSVLVNGLAEIDLRGRGLMCTGDSGGPVYANALGFGLVSGGSLSGSPRTIDNGVYRVTVSCGTSVVYVESLPRAASRLGILIGAADWRARLGWQG